MTYVAFFKSLLFVQVDLVIQTLCVLKVRDFKVILKCFQEWLEQKLGEKPILDGCIVQLLK